VNIPDHAVGFGSKTWQVFETCQVSFLLTPLPPLPFQGEGSF